MSSPVAPSSSPVMRASSLLTGTSGCHTVAHHAMVCLIRKAKHQARPAHGGHPAVKGAEIITEYLIRERGPCAVGLCGPGDLGLLDALYRRRGQIRTLSVHHESAAG